MNVKKYLTVLVAAAIVLPAASCAFREKTVKRSDFALNTLINITVTGKSADSAADAALAEIKRIDALMNTHSSKSALYALNCASAGERVRVSAEIFKLIKTSAQISEKTGGAFDITLKPVADLWAIGTENPRVPQSGEILGALEKTGYENMILNEEDCTVEFKKDGMQIDLGGIAKGYAANRAAEILKNAGIKSALLDLGGNVYAVGQRSDGQRWRVGLQTPWKTRGEYFKTVSVSDTSVVTSGAYERYFEDNSEIYHHILNPENGYPSKSGIQSATVICTDSALADALSTAVFVSGSEGARRIAENFDNVKIILYTDDGEILEY